MSQEEILKLITEIEKKLRELRVEIDIDGNTVTERREKKTTSQKRKGQKKKKRIGATKYVEDFIDSGFFDNPKSDLDVAKEFKKKALNFKRTDIAITLIRFVRKGRLGREGDGTKSNPWKYKKK